MTTVQPEVPVFIFGSNKRSRDKLVQLLNECSIPFRMSDDAAEVDFSSANRRIVLFDIGSPSALPADEPMLGTVLNQPSNSCIICVGSTVDLQVWRGIAECAHVLILGKPLTAASLVSAVSTLSSVEQPAGPGPVAPPGEPAPTREFYGGLASSLRSLLGSPTAALAEKQVRLLAALALDYEADAAGLRNSCQRNPVVASHGRLKIETADIVGRLQRRFEPQAAARGVRMTVSFETPVPATFDGEVGLLMQLLSYCLEVALDQTTNGRIRLAVRYEQSSRIISFSVSDSGCGYGAGLISEHRTKLAGIERLSRELRGQLVIERIEMVGSRYRFDLRCDNPSNVMIDSISSEGPVHRPFHLPSIADIEGTVLVGMTSRLEYQLLQGIFSTSRLKFVPVCDGKSFADEARNNPFDLAVCDVNLPELNTSCGFKLPGRNGEMLPIVALAPHEEMSSWVEAGAICAIPFPLELERLTRIVKFLLNFGSPRAERSNVASSDATVHSTSVEAAPGNSGTPVRRSNPAAGSEIVQLGGEDVIFGSPDLEALRNRSNMIQYDESSFPHVVEFIGSLGGEFRRLAGHIAKADYKKAHFLANQLAGTAAVCGLIDLGEGFRDLEMVCDSERRDDLTRALEHVQQLAGSLMLPTGDIGKTVAVATTAQPVAVTTTTPLELEPPAPEAEDAAPPPVIHSKIADQSPELIPLILDFLDTLDGYLERLEDAYDKAAWRKLEALAHECCGVSSMYGYPEFSTVTKQLQLAVAQENRREIAGILRKARRLAAGMVAGRSSLEASSKE